jgi:hypothetical protein
MGRLQALVARSLLPTSGIVHFAGKSPARPQVWRVLHEGAADRDKRVSARADLSCSAGSEDRNVADLTAGLRMSR